MSVPVAPDALQDDAQARAVWSTAMVNDFPDSSFAYVEPGEKDEDGKTTPRTNRHLPYKDGEGKVDAAHVRNALARLSQTQIPAAAKAAARRKLVAAAKSVGVEVSEDADRVAEPAEPLLRSTPATTAEARAWFPIRSIDQETREIQGVLSDETEDKHGTIFNYDGMKSAVQRWAGNIREQHDPRKAVGRKVAAFFDDEKREVTLRARISKGAQDTWEKILDGTLGGFSVGAYNVRKLNKRTIQNRVVPEFLDFDLFEASVVDVPSNNGAEASGLTIFRAADCSESGQDEYNADFDDYPLPDEPVADADAAAAALDPAGDESRATAAAPVEDAAPVAEPVLSAPQPRQILKGAQQRIEGGGDLAFTPVPLSPLSPAEIAGLEAEGSAAVPTPEPELAATRAVDASGASNIDPMESDRGPHEHTHAHEDDYSPLHLHGHEHTHTDGTTHDHRHMHNHAHHDHFGDEDHAHLHKHIHDHNHMYRVVDGVQEFGFRSAAPDTSVLSLSQPGEAPAAALTRDMALSPGAFGEGVETNTVLVVPGVETAVTGCGCCDNCTGPGCGCCDGCEPPVDTRASTKAPAKAGKKGDAQGDAEEGEDDEDAEDEDETDDTPGGKNASRAAIRAGKRISRPSANKIHRSVQELLELCNCDDCQDAMAALNHTGPDGDGDADDVSRAAHRLTRAVERELSPLHGAIIQLRAVAARLATVQGSDWSRVQGQLDEQRSATAEVLRLVSLIAEQEQPGAPVTRGADAHLTPVDKRLAMAPDAVLDASKAKAQDLAAELEQIRAAGGFRNLQEQMDFATRLTSFAPILQR